MFGVYYSQSHDWSHPGGQNNTWDFPWQPTQSNWWRTPDGKRNLAWAAHFERSAQYLHEKAMPQRPSNIVVQGRNLGSFEQHDTGPA
jgi:hypothetical protein